MRSLIAAAIILITSNVLAEGDHRHGHAAPAVRGSDTSATQAFREAAARMHHDMAVPYANDVDVDFLRGMIPHHAGAIAMAKITLAHSKDPDVRKLAEDIVRAQEGEIAQMTAMLKQRQAVAGR